MLTIIYTLTGKSTFLILLISIFGILQRVPLSDWTSGRRQHVGPMSQFCSVRVVSQDYLANRFWCTDAIVIYYGDDELHFLKNQYCDTSNIFHRIYMYNNKDTTSLRVNFQFFFFASSSAIISIIALANDRISIFVPVSARMEPRRWTIRCNMD